MKLLGYTITTDYPQLPVKNKTIVNTINPHSYCVSKQDLDFEKALKTSDVLFIYTMRYLDKTKGSCFFLGASEKTLEAITQKVAYEFPNVKFSTFSPPYSSVFTEEESSLMCQKVNAIGPEIVFIGMTAPKQEKWSYQYKDFLDSKIICSIGAVFDFYAGTVKRPSQFWIKMGLEWLPRFFKEPKRLARRNLISTPKFILEVICFKIWGKGIL